MAFTFAWRRARPTVASAIFGAASCLALVGAVPHATAAKINWAERSFALELAEPASLAAPGIELLSAEKLTARFTLKELPQNTWATAPGSGSGGGAQPLGVWVPAATEATLRVNGRDLNQDGVPRDGGQTFLLSPECLVPAPGENSLEVTRRASRPGAAASWVGLRVFTLLSPGEELHFTREFADPPRPFVGADGRTRVAPPQAPGETGFDVKSYDLVLEPTVWASSISSATMTMHAVCTSASLAVVPLDFDTNAGALPVASVDAGSAAAPLGFTFDAQDHLLITMPAPLADGQPFTVRVAYSGTPNTITPNGSGIQPYRYTTHGPLAKPLVHSYSQPYAARCWWPCKDRPDDQADTCSLHLVIPSGQGLSALSNGFQQPTTTSPDFPGKEVWNWLNPYPIVTQYVVFHVSDYVQTPTATYTALDAVTTMPITHYIWSENTLYEGAGQLGTLQAMNFFARTFGEYPYLNSKYATASWRYGGGLEHQTLTGMPDANSGARTVQSVGDGRTRRNVHELAHMWYANKVTYAPFDHVWLGEGFASYAEALFDESTGGYAAYLARLTGWYGSMTYTGAVVSTSGDDYNTGRIYYRGGWALHMLRRVMGDTTMTQTFKNWTSPPYLTTAESYRATTTSEFLRVAELTSGLELDPFFNQWLYRPNADGAALPVYRCEPYATRSGSNWAVNVRIEQRQTGTVPFTMPLDFRVFFDDGTSHTITVQNATKALTDFPLIASTPKKPLRVVFDPDTWVLKNSAPSARTVGLPAGTTGQPYSANLEGNNTYVSGTAPTFSWSLSGAPAWLSLAGSSLSGTPPASGTYSFFANIVSSGGIPTYQVPLEITVANGPPPPPPPPIVLNEVYINSGGGGDFIELANTSATAADISGLQVLLVNGATGTAYQTITLPPATSLAGGSYFVIGAAASVGASVDYEFSLDSLLQSDAPDAVVLKTGAGVLLDALNQRADAVYAAGGERANAISRGGFGRIVSRALADPAAASFSRLPDAALASGAAWDRNLLDYAICAPSPGAANGPAASTAFSDDFNSGTPNPLWRGSFTVPSTATPGASGKPATTSAGAGGSGGSCLEVIDYTGGGDVAVLPAALPALNVTGYLWTPASAATLGSAGGYGWSCGVGIAARSESGWFSGANGLGIENGYYLEYQNGPLNASPNTLKGGAIASHPQVLNFYAVNGASSVNAGAAATTVSLLGSLSISAAQQGRWNSFRLVFDYPNATVAATFDGTVLYEGPLPAGSMNRSGGVVVGFREEHTGAPSATIGEGTWVDDLQIDGNVPVALRAFDAE